MVTYFFFFFQAEDGIRDLIVTGVQTCALPILPRRSGSELRQPPREHAQSPGHRAQADVRADTSDSRDRVQWFPQVRGRAPKAKSRACGARGKARCPVPCPSFRPREWRCGSLRAPFFAERKLRLFALHQPLDVGVVLVND